MDELERAGSAVRDDIAETEPGDHVRARARTIVRRRRMLTAGSVAAIVIAASVGIGIAAHGGNNLGVHTIAPAGPSTTRTPTTTGTPTTTPVVPKGTTVPVPVETTPGLVAVTGLPTMVAIDSQHLWRVEPVHQESVEFSADGGRSWVTRLRVAGSGDEPDTVQGIVAFDDHDAIVLGFEGNTPEGAPLPMFLARTSDGMHWKRLELRGLPAQLVSISFVDLLHGWGVTNAGGVVTTVDGGDDWRATGRPGQTGLLVCLGSPGQGWVVSATTVYRSVDDGATWAAQVAVPAFGGDEVYLACSGNHAAYASYSVGAGQHAGAFFRTDDGGAHWRPLTEDFTAPARTVSAPGFPDNQLRGEPTEMTSGGTLVFLTGCYVCDSSQNWVVLASPTDRFVVGRFDSTTGQEPLRSAASSHATFVFAEIQTISADGTGPRPIELYASTDGGHTWHLRWTGQE